MVNALRDVAGDEVAARVKWDYDPAIDRIVSTWPSNFAPKLGPALGMRADADFARHRPRVHRRRHAALVSPPTSGEALARRTSGQPDDEPRGPARLELFREIARRAHRPPRRRRWSASSATERSPRMMSVPSRVGEQAAQPQLAVAEHGVAARSACGSFRRARARTRAPP